MSRWRSLVNLARAMAEVWRFNPDPTARPDPRAERLAAGGIGVLVLVGAVGTYLVVVGGFTPLLADVPAGGQPAQPPVTASTGPDLPSAGLVTAVPTETAYPTPEQSASPTPRPTRRTTPPATTTVQAVPPAPAETTSVPATTEPPTTATEPPATTPATPDPG